MVGSWPDRRHDIDLYDLFPNPNKFRKGDPDLKLHSPCLEYYLVRGFIEMRVNSDVKYFEFFTTILQVYLKPLFCWKNYYTPLSPSWIYLELMKLN